MADLKKLKSDVKEVFMTNPKTSMKEVADDIAVSKSTISRVVKVAGGQSL